MDPQWKGAIAKTLHSTEETLRRLQERQAHYNVAKHRVEEAFAGSRRATSGRRYDDPILFHHTATALDDSDIAVPPPLPSNYATMPPPHHRSYLLENGNNNNNSHHYDTSLPLSDGRPAATVKHLYDAYKLMKSRVKSMQVELELERTIRSDSMREMKSCHDNQVAELKGMIHQLRDECGFLRNSVKALEAQSLGYGGEGSAVRRRDPLWDAKSALLNSVIDTDSYVAAASLSQRVADLEGTVVRQQRLLDERQMRVDSVLRDLVNAKVETEVEHMRSIAREAARESAGDLIQLRLGAVQSMVNQELHKVVGSTNDAQRSSRDAEQLVARLEKDWTRKWDTMEDTVRDLQSCASSWRKSERSDGDQKLQDAVDMLQRQVDNCRQEVKQNAQHISQSTAAKIDSARSEILASVTHTVEEASRRDGAVRETDVRRMIESAVQPLHGTVDSVQHAIKRVKESADSANELNGQRISAVEDSTKTMKDQVHILQDALRENQTGFEKVKSEVSKHTTQLQQCTLGVEHAQSAATEGLENSRQTNSAQVEFAAKVDAQIKSIKLTLEKSEEHVRSAIQGRTSMEERLAKAESSLVAVESAVSRSVQPITVKLEALGSVLHQECLPQLGTLRNEVQDISVRYQQQTDSKAYQDKLVSQQLADLKKDADTRLRDTENRLRREQDEGQMRLEGQLEAQTKKLIPMSKNIASLTENISKIEYDQESTQASIKTLQEKVVALQRSSEGNADQIADNKKKEQPKPQPQQKPEEDEAPLLEEVSMLSNKLDAVVGAQMKGLDVMADRLASLEESHDLLNEELAAMKKGREIDAKAMGRAADDVQQKLTDFSSQMQRQDGALREQLGLLSERLDGLSAHHSTAIQSSSERMKELVTPTRLVNAILTSDVALEQLSGGVEPHLGQLRVVEESVVQLRGSLKKVEQQQAKLQASLEATAAEMEAKVAKPTDSGSSSPAEVAAAAAKEALAPMRAQCEAVTVTMEAVQDGHRKMQQQLQDVQTSVDENRARVDEVLVPLQLRVSTVEGECRSLLEVHNSIPITMQQKINSLQERLAVEQEDALRPLHSKVRSLEERTATSEDAAANISREVASMASRCAGQQQQLEGNAAALESLKTRVSTQHDSLLSNHIEPLQQRLQDHTRPALKTMEAHNDKLAEMAHKLQDMAPRVNHVETIIKGLQKLQLEQQQQQEQQTAASPVEQPQRREPLLAEDAAQSKRLADMESRLVEVEEQLHHVAETGEVGLQATADTLSSLRDGLHRCVTRVAQELQQRPWLTGGRESNTNADGNSTTVDEGAATSTEGTADIPQLDALDDVLVFTLHQLSDLHDGVQTLQQNAIATLDIIQQQEMDVSAIPQLQQAVLHLVAELKPIAQACGVDPSLLDVDVGGFSPLDG